MAPRICYQICAFPDHTDLKTEGKNNTISRKMVGEKKGQLKKKEIKIMIMKPNSDKMIIAEVDY